MYDFIAIGDIVTDAFIRLKDAKVNCDINTDKCTISMSFGDKIPYESLDVVRAVGNSPNASVSASRLGLKSALVTNVGNDEAGKECIESLKQDGVFTDFVKTHDNKKTNYHYVLWYESDRTILVKHEDFTYELPQFDAPKWIYLSSMGESSKEFHKVIADYVEKNPLVNLAFQPGTFQMLMGKDELKDIYSHSKIVFCNTEEAGRILGVETLGIKELLKRMKELGPEIVVITDGPKGAYAYDGEKTYFQKPYPDPKPPLERTGAGDAFSSTVASALALGNDLPTALAWGAVNSMAVVQEIGAQRGLLTRDALEEYMKKAPEGFLAETI